MMISAVKGILLCGMLSVTIASAEDRRAVQRPTLKGDPSDWFGPAAYPAEALRQNQEGRTVAEVSVDPSGRATSCLVSISSGAPSLDKATCDIAMANATFSAAINANGKAIFSTYTLPVHWTLPDSGKFRFASFGTNQWVEFSADGNRVSCGLDIRGAPSPEPKGGPCDAQSNVNFAASDWGPYLHQHVVIGFRERLSVTGDPFPDPPAGPMHVVTVLRRVEFGVSPDGSITKCKLIEAKGLFPGEDLCSEFPEGFEPAKLRITAERTGTYEMSYGVDPIDAAK